LKSTGRFKGSLAQLVTALLLCGLERTGMAQTTPATPSFPSGVELLTVDAVVVDGKGHPVADLVQGDFIVTEDGQPQPIASFETIGLQGVSKAGGVPGTVGDAALSPASESVAEPASVASNQRSPVASGRAFTILLDDVWIPVLERPRVIKNVGAFLNRSLRDGDEVTLANTTGDMRWCARLPEGREDLIAVLARLRGRLAAHDQGRDEFVNGKQQLGTMSEYHAFRIVSGLETGDRGIAAEIDALRRDRMRLTLGAAGRELRALVPGRGRKSLLLVSQGFIADGQAGLREVTTLAHEANIAVYFLDVRGLRTTPGYSADNADEPDKASVIESIVEQDVLDTAGSQDLADDTGGFSVRNTNDISIGAGRIAEESRVFYLLGIHPLSGKPPGEWRKLTVEVKRPGLQVHARRGYALRRPDPSEAPPAAHESEQPRGVKDSSLLQTLDSAHDTADIPLRAMAYVNEPLNTNMVGGVLVTELDASRLAARSAGGPRVARLELTILAVSRETGQTFRRDDTSEIAIQQNAIEWRSLVRPLGLPKGVVQMRVVVRDVVSGKLGSLTLRVEVPEPQGLRLSTPILSDRVEPAKDAGDRPRPRLVAHRTFPSKGTLYVQYEVFGSARPTDHSAPRVASGLEIRTTDGRLVRHADPTPVAADPDGRVVRLTGLGLADIADGRYDLVVQVHDEVGGGRVERHEPFTLSKGVE
jgi:VWFA-related protein